MMREDLLLKTEQDRQNINSTLHITAYEAPMSEKAKEFLHHPYAERYSFAERRISKKGIIQFDGFLAKSFTGLEKLVGEATKATKKSLNASNVNLGPLSGVNAMMCAILSSTKPGDTVLSVKPQDGGHFSTKGIIKITGRYHGYLEFDQDRLMFNTEKITEIVKRRDVKAIYLDVSYYLNPHNLRDIRYAVGKKPIIIYDASHTIGLILGGKFQDPFGEGADIICNNTHKTLPGPHSGMISFKDRHLADKCNEIINTDLFSSSQSNHLAALAITLLEIKEHGRQYASQIIKNANALGEAFSELGYKLRLANTGRFTENHQIHVFTDDATSQDQYQNLLRNNISSNLNGQNVLGNRHFFRFGTQDVTRRGMNESEMKYVASLVDKALKGVDVKNDVTKLVKLFPNVRYC